MRIDRVCKLGESATMPKHDDLYLRAMLDPLRVCAHYRPKLGQGQGDGSTLDQFRTLYQSNSFYSWIGLDNPLMYAAHKAAGGMTSMPIPIVPAQS